MAGPGDVSVALPGFTLTTGEPTTTTTASTCRASVTSRPTGDYRGEQWDPDLGLYYLRARYYNPLSGRFFSVDPMTSEGEPRYEYADADPVDNADPTGQAAIVEFLLLNFRGVLHVNFPTWCNESASNPMIAYLPGCDEGGGGGDGLGSGGGPPTPCHGADCNHIVKIHFWPEDAFGNGHVGVGVDTDNTEGFYPANGFWRILTPVMSVPGKVFFDRLKHPTTNPDVLEHRISQNQATAMKDEIHQWRANPGSYNLTDRNCANLVEDVLRAGGMPAEDIDQGEKSPRFLYRYLETLGGFDGDFVNIP